MGFTHLNGDRFFICAVREILRSYRAPGVSGLARRGRAITNIVFVETTLHKGDMIWPICKSRLYFYIWIVFGASCVIYIFS